MISPSANNMDITILDRTLYNSNLPQERNNLVADVHFGSEQHQSNVIVEVQHRTEVNFPHRAILYSSADVIQQRFLDGVTRDSFDLKPVHHISFCDYSFATNKASEVTLSRTRWKTSKTVWDTNKAFAAYGLGAKNHRLREVLAVDMRGTPHSTSI